MVRESTLFYEPYYFVLLWYSRFYCSPVFCILIHTVTNPPTQRPTGLPTTKSPTVAPTPSPTRQPTIPTPAPTKIPTTSPTKRPTLQPTTSSAPSGQVRPLCGTQGMGLSPANYTDVDFGNSGNFNPNEFLMPQTYVNDGYYEFSITESCEYRYRSVDTNFQNVVLRDPDDFFETAATLLGGSLRTNKATTFFNGMSAPTINSTGVVGCLSGKFCVSASGNGVTNGPIVYQFNDSVSQQSFLRVINTPAPSGSSSSTAASLRSKIFGTNWYWKCGSPPFCYDEGKGTRGTCYVQPLTIDSSLCGDVDYKIDYVDGAQPATSVAGGTKNFFPWFDECCSTFKCTRDAASSSPTYTYPSSYSTSSGTVIFNGVEKHWFNLTWGSGSSAGSMRWTCPSYELAKGLEDFADTVEDQNLHRQNSTNLICSSTKAPTKAPTKTPTRAPNSSPPPTSVPVTPCRNVNNRGVCTDHPNGICYLAPSSTCHPFDFAVTSSTGTRLFNSNEVYKWMDNCLTTTLGCSRSGDLPSSWSYTFSGTIDPLVFYNNDNKWEVAIRRPSNTFNAAFNMNDINYICTTREAAIDAKEVSYCRLMYLNLHYCDDHTADETEAMESTYEDLTHPIFIFFFR
jgi:hypothetical protein